MQERILFLRQNSITSHWLANEFEWSLSSTISPRRKKSSKLIVVFVHVTFTSGKNSRGYFSLRNVWALRTLPAKIWQLTTGWNVEAKSIVDHMMTCFSKVNLTCEIPLLHREILTNKICTTKSLIRQMSSFQKANNNSSALLWMFPAMSIPNQSIGDVECIPMIARVFVVELYFSIINRENETIQINLRQELI